MSAPVTTEQVWSTIQKRIFGVLSFVTPGGEARSAGIIYAVAGNRLYVATQADSWKAKYIARDPAVALTVTIPKRIPFLPWIHIPDATISLHGEARILEADRIEASLRKKLLGTIDVSQAVRDRLVVIEITPVGFLSTYGVGVPLMTMRRPEDSRGRVPVPVAA